ncbi:MAG TPA: cation:proton antiporter, partial [Microlunatus sp.]|nr:cation:proton antiporter [Microlunatus sp.]
MVTLPALALVLLAVFAWAAVSGRAQAVSAPIFFVGVGLVLTEGLQVLQLTPDRELVKLLAELTLVWVLFADASRVRMSSLRQDASRYVRLLGVGLPLTVVLGGIIALGLLGLEPWYALLLGAALAPTDAALGAAVMTDERVPYRIRQTLNVESGLNDGIATPLVTTALAAIVIESGAAADFGLWRALLGLPVGVLVGVLVGLCGGTVLRLAHRRGWSS